MSTAVRVVLLGLLLAALGATLLARIYEREAQALHAPMPLSERVEFTVTAGATITKVATDMASRAWIASPRFFAWYTRYRGQAQSIKAGTYALEPGMSPMDALALFISGREVQYPFTIVEGWTFEELRAALSRTPHLRQTLEGVDGAEVMARLAREGRHPEGMFLADTYLFPPGASDLDALRRALGALESTLEDAWQARSKGLPLREPYEALILASIIEKETADAGERPLIAGVFVERLRRGMLLQTDPTVIYGLGAAFDGNLRRRDLRADTPYNTYTRKGLPPTPIAMVGRDAIRAALAPEFDGSLYFVSRGDGSHHFSRTYDEHLRAVQRFQLGGAKASGG